LLRERVAALLRNIHDEDDGSLQMGQSSDGLHLNGVHVVNGMVQNTGRINHLPADVAVVHVANEEGLGGEGVRLNIDVRVRDLVHEAGLAHVGITADQQGARVWINGGQTGEMLAHLLQVRQRSTTMDNCLRKVAHPKYKPVALHHGAHATQRRLLERLAAVKRISILQQANVIFSQRIDEGTRGIQLTKSELETTALDGLQKTDITL
jgi:hypothetical protein